MGIGEVALEQVKAVLYGSDVLRAGAEARQALDGHALAEEQLGKVAADEARDAGDPGRLPRLVHGNRALHPVEVSLLSGAGHSRWLNSVSDQFRPQIQYWFGGGPTLAKTPSQREITSARAN